jgi:tetratricopeptide (TPR) repeat protein
VGDVFALTEAELDNVRAALDWCFAHGRVEEALEAISALGRFWRAHGDVGEARRLLERGISLADGIPDDVRARALWTAAHEAMIQSDYRAAVPALEEALVLFRRLGDDRHAVFSLCELARALSSQGELDGAERAGTDALAIAEDAGDTRAASAALDTLAMVADYRGHHQNAQALSERSLELRRTLGDAILIASSTNTVGLSAMRAGDLDVAERAFTECLELARTLGEKVYVAAAQCALGEIALARELPGIAAERLLEAVALFSEIGHDRACAECLHALGGVAAAEGHPLDAMRLWGAAAELRERTGAGLVPEEKEVDRRFADVVASAADAAQLDAARSEGRALAKDPLEAVLPAITDASERHRIEVST